MVKYIEVNWTFLVSWFAMPSVYQPKISKVLVLIGSGVEMAEGRWKGRIEREGGLRHV